MRAAYVGGVSILGGVALLVAGAQALSEGVDPASAALFAALTVLAELLPVQSPEYGELSVAPALHLPAIILFPPGAAAVFAAAASLVADLRQRKPAHKLVFNVGQYTLTVLAATAVYRRAGPGLEGGLLPALPAIALAAAVYYALNVTFVCFAHGLTAGLSPFGLWPWLMRSLLPVYAALFSLGTGVAVIYHAERAALLLLLLPIVIVRAALRGTIDLQHQTEEALQALASMVDRRDPFTAGHSRRVAQLAEAIARELALPEAEVVATRAAARIHDIGKASLPTMVAYKRDPLGEGDWEAIRAHAEEGGGFTLRLPACRDLTPLVRHHHERWDGKGYPDGLKATEIPLGARIIAAADAYDALTSERPYRRALPAAAALREVRANAGFQFDPRVIDALERVVACYGGEAAAGSAPAGGAGAAGMPGAAANGSG